MITFGEMMFYAEAEGLLPTRAGKINAVIADIKAIPRPEITQDEFEQILRTYGLTYKGLSPRERHYIDAMIS